MILALQVHHLDLHSRPCIRTHRPSRDIGGPFLSGVYAAGRMLPLGLVQNPGLRQFMRAFLTSTKVGSKTARSSSVWTPRSGTYTLTMESVCSQLQVLRARNATCAADSPGLLRLICTSWPCSESCAILYMRTYCPAICKPLISLGSYRRALYSAQVCFATLAQAREPRASLPANFVQICLVKLRANLLVTLVEVCFTSLVS